MQHLFSIRWTRRFVVEFAMVSVLLLIMAPLAACGGGGAQVRGRVEPRVDR